MNTKRYLALISIILFSQHGFADSRGGDSCGDLYLDLTNSTAFEANLVGEPNNQVKHGYITRRGHQLLPSKQSTTWIVSSYPFTGPTGTLKYEWTDGDEKKHVCNIAYDQQYCFLRGGENRTSATGDCTVTIDTTKPSVWWSLHGEARIVFTHTQ